MRPTDADMITSAVKAMKEKLDENEHKPSITMLDLDTAISLMKDELEELKFELWALTIRNGRTADNLKAIRRELADVMNFAGAAVVACERELAGEHNPIVNADGVGPFGVPWSM